VGGPFGFSGVRSEDTLRLTLWYYVVRSSVRHMETAQLLRGVLDLAVLAVVAEEDGYGYDVVRRLRAAGLSDLGDASVYGTLRRLYGAGALTSYVVASEEGPHRKYYGITTAGRDDLKRQSEDWRAFSTTITSLINSKETAA
jgi:PadR family transcriptional regulator, regulatory protein PadR